MSRALNRALAKADRAHGIFTNVLAQLENAADALWEAHEKHQKEAQDHAVKAEVARKRASAALQTASRVRELTGE